MSNKYFAILNNDQTLFVELTPERLDVLLYQYEGDEAWYVADVLSEEFGFSINNVQWSVISPEKIKCVGEPIVIAQPEPSSSFIIRHHVSDPYEGGLGEDRIWGPYSSREEALEVLESHTYEDDYHELQWPDVDAEKGVATYFDGWCNHILRIIKL